MKENSTNKYGENWRRHTSNRTQSRQDFGTKYENGEIKTEQNKNVWIYSKQAELHILKEDLHVEIYLDDIKKTFKNTHGATQGLEGIHWFWFKKSLPSTANWLPNE